MHLHRPDRTNAKPAPEQSFTGDVRVDGYHRRESPSRIAGATVAFAPASRTPWTVNPTGQTVVVTSGLGRARAEGETAVEVRVGDLLWFPPGQAHWVGAAPDQAMSCAALQEEGDGGAVRFLGEVTDEQYATLGSLHDDDGEQP